MELTNNHFIHGYPKRMWGSGGTPDFLLNNYLHIVITSGRTNLKARIGGCRSFAAAIAFVTLGIGIFYRSILCAGYCDQNHPATDFEDRSRQRK